MNDKYKDYTRTALINELEVYKHAINEGAQRIEERDQRIAELEEETEAYQKEINDFCNKRHFGCLKDADKKLTELEEKCKWQDKEIELDGEKLKALEEENKELKESNRIKTYYVSECNRLYDEQQKENAKLKDKIDALNYAKNTVDYWACRDKKVKELQEQMKNAPKFELGQDVFIVVDNIEKAKIEKIISTISKAEEECANWYSITDRYGYALRLPEEQIFATEAEAQKYLEKHK